jgi:hypothetical protein
MDCRSHKSSVTSSMIGSEESMCSWTISLLLLLSCVCVRAHDICQDSKSITAVSGRQLPIELGFESRLGVPAFRTFAQHVLHSTSSVNGKEPCVLDYHELG